MKDCSKWEVNAECTCCGENLLSLVKSGDMKNIYEIEDDDGNLFCCEDCLEDYRDD